MYFLSNLWSSVWCFQEMENGGIGMLPIATVATPTQDNTRKEWFKAARENDIEKVKDLISSGFFPDTLDKVRFNASPLFLHFPPPPFLLFLLILHDPAFYRILCFFMLYSFFKKWKFYPNLIYSFLGMIYITGKQTAVNDDSNKTDTRVLIIIMMMYFFNQ